MLIGMNPILAQLLACTGRKMEQGCKIIPYQKRSKVGRGGRPDRSPVLAERARSECARSTRAIKDQPGRLPGKIRASSEGALDCGLIGPLSSRNARPKKEHSDCLFGGRCGKANVSMIEESSLAVESQSIEERIFDSLRTNGTQTLDRLAMHGPLKDGRQCFSLLTG